MTKKFKLNGCYWPHKLKEMFGLLPNTSALLLDANFTYFVIMTGGGVAYINKKTGKVDKWIGEMGGDLPHPWGKQMKTAIDAVGAGIAVLSVTQNMNEYEGIRDSAIKMMTLSIDTLKKEAAKEAPKTI